MAETITCDVLVIGGGATGAGTAYDLAARGLRVVLTEMNDWCTGTSGRYHGLLHSGGRYAVYDPESARECINENRIVRRIAPHAIENTGGMFVSVQGDPSEYAEMFVAGCAATGIPTHELSIDEARQRAPALTPAALRAFDVPDAACDSFDLVHSLVAAARAYGARTLNYHRVTAFQVAHGAVVGAMLENQKTSMLVKVEAAYTVNAAGPWADSIAALAGVPIKLRHSKGIMIAMNIRWVHTIINRLKPPDDGDILVPVGTVCVIGTTAITVPRADDISITQAEISQMLDGGELLIPGFRAARALRVWAGVRPLYEPPNKDNFNMGGRELKRTFEVIDHEVQDGVGGLTSIVGGKLTTFRLMAERVTDSITARLGVDKPCITAQAVLPEPETRARFQHFHQLPSRLAALEHASIHTGLICECELVTRPQLESAITESGTAVKLDDLRRDLRLGMGPCQAGFCAYRAAGIVNEMYEPSASQSNNELLDFIEERFRGNRPLLWGHQLRQALLDESIYRRSFGLSTPPPSEKSIDG